MCVCVYQYLFGLVEESGRNGCGEGGMIDRVMMMLDGKRKV